MNSFRRCSFGRRYMRVSINGGSPKWLVYQGKSHEIVWFGATPILGNLHMMTYEGWVMMKSKMPVPKFQANGFWNHKSSAKEHVLNKELFCFGDVVNLVGMIDESMWPCSQRISGVKRIGVCRQNAVNFSVHPVKPMRCTKEMCRWCRRIWMKWGLVVHLAGEI